GLAEIMSGIDAQTTRLRVACGGRAGSECRTVIATRVRLGERPGIQLDAVGTDARRGGDVGAGIGKQAHPAAQRLERSDQWREDRGVAGEVETMVGSQLAIAVGYQRRLRGPHLLAERNEA